MTTLQTYIDEMYLALGRAVLIWNIVESKIAEAFRVLLQADDIATYTVWQSFQSLSPRLDMIDQLATKRLSEKDAALIADLTRYSKKLAGERNFIAHSLLDFSANDGTFVVAGPPKIRKADLLKKKYAVDPDELLELAKDFSHLATLWENAATGLENASLQKSLGAVTFRRPLRASRPQNDRKARS